MRAVGRHRPATRPGRAMDPIAPLRLPRRRAPARRGMRGRPRPGSTHATPAGGPRSPSGAAGAAPPLTGGHGTRPAEAGRARPGAARPSAPPTLTGPTAATWAAGAGLDRDGPRAGAAVDRPRLAHAAAAGRSDALNRALPPGCGFRTAVEVMDTHQRPSELATERTAAAERVSAACSVVADRRGEHRDDPAPVDHRRQRQAHVAQPVLAVEQRRHRQDALLVLEHRLDDPRRRQPDRVVRGALAADDLLRGGDDLVRDPVADLRVQRGHPGTDQSATGIGPIVACSTAAAPSRRARRRRRRARSAPPPRRAARAGCAGGSCRARCPSRTPAPWAARRTSARRR